MSLESAQQPTKTVKSVKIVEVGPRDGLQNEKTIIDTATKIDFILKLAEAGLKYIEVTSFVHPKAIPQLSDAVDVVKGLSASPGVHYSALVPNTKGLERALESGIREIAVFTATSNTFTKNNINMTVDESFAAFAPVVQRARAAGMFVRGYVSTAFYCPYEGKMNKDTALDVTRRLLDMGVQEVSIGDTIGQATPQDVTETMRHMLQHVPVEKLAMHFHDTNGLALENVEASLNLGLSIFDSSAGGLGGCPYAPGASGNLSTDSLVEFLEGRGIATGVNREKLAEASEEIRKVLNNAELQLINPDNIQDLAFTPYPSRD
jgi:hydroxymethylglutaryl-CoA lyase